MTSPALRIRSPFPRPRVQTSGSMRRRLGRTAMKRSIIILATLSALLGTATLTGQTVATGEAVVSENEYRSPMTLEMPFVLADPARWNDKWSADTDYADLAKYCCERVFVESLRMRARRVAGDAVAITIKTKLRNPNGNHDKRVFLTVELQNDGVAVGMSRRSAPLPPSTRESISRKATPRRRRPSSPYGRMLSSPRRSSRSRCLYGTRTERRRARPATMRPLRG